MYPLRVAACSQCRLVQLAEPMRTTAGLDHGHAAAVSTTVADHERYWATDLVSHLARGSRPRRVLDVSCGDGNLLRAIAAAADPASVECLGFGGVSGLSTGPRQRDIELTSEPFDDASAIRLARAGWTADLVIVSQGLAHVDDPGGLLDAISATLSPAGLLAIEAHHVLGIVRDGQFDVINHAHAIYPSLADLLGLLEPRGFAVTALEAVDAYGGSLRLLARRKEDGEPSEAEAVVPGMALVGAEESAARLEDPATLAQVERRAKRVARDLRNFLVDRRGEGSVVVGYGAPARAAVLLNLAGVGPDLLPFTVDRNPAKQGLVLAGSRIPVFRPDRLDSPRPDYVLVLPWTLQSEIASQLAPLREAGTRLIVALPRLRVI